MDRSDLFAWQAGNEWDRIHACLRGLSYIVLLRLVSWGAMWAVVGPINGSTRWLLSSAYARGAATVACTAIIAFLARQPLRLFGTALDRSLVNFPLGMAAGLLLLCIELLVMGGFGAYSLGEMTHSAPDFFGPALYGLIAFLAVAFSEDLRNLGYALVQFSRAVTFWPAALVVSFYYGFAHISNPGETLLGIASAAGFGLALAISFRLTGSLWFALGLHAAWDFGETFVFGVPNSGLMPHSGFFHSSIVGPDWLTGGITGPEGSVLIVLPLLGIVLLSWVLRKTNFAELAANKNI